MLSVLTVCSDIRWISEEDEFTKQSAQNVFHSIDFQTFVKVCESNNFVFFLNY